MSSIVAVVTIEANRYNEIIFERHVFDISALNLFFQCYRLKLLIAKAEWRNNMEQQNERPQVVVTKSTKSAGISLLLTFLFGPLGMLYANILHGIIMIVLAFIIGFVTFGLGSLITWPISMIWGYIDVKSYNKKLLQGKY